MWGTHIHKGGPPWPELKLRCSRLQVQCFYHWTILLLYVCISILCKLSCKFLSESIMLFVIYCRYLSQTQIPASVSYPGHDSTNTAKKDGQAPNRSRRRNNNSKQQTLTTPLLEQPTGMPQKSPRKLQSHTKKNVSTCNEKAGRAMSWPVCCYL